MENIDKLIEGYTKIAIEYGNALKIGDHRVANKSYTKLKRIYKIFEKDHLFAEEVLKSLFQIDNDLVKICAAAHALGLNLFIDQAQQFLLDISKKKDIGIIRFEAEMTLEEWKKKGQLKF